MKAYKGFSKDLTCNEYQYEVGKTYECEDAEVCDHGFHACLRPADVFAYYTPAASRYCEVDVDEDGLSRSDDDSKVAARRITIVREINLWELYEAQMEYAREHEDESEVESKRPVAVGGDRSAVTGSGGSSVAGGDKSFVVGGAQASVAGGNRSSVTGRQGSAVAGGNRSAVVGGNHSAVAGGDRSDVACGDQAAASGGRLSAVSGGDLSAVSGGDSSTVKGGYHSAVAGGDWSDVIGGDRSAVAGGRNSFVKAFSRSTLAGGDESTVIGGAQSAAVSRRAVSVGDNGAALCRGRGCRIRGGIGAVLVIAVEDKKTHDIATWKAVVVDGVKIRANTWYKLVNGKLVEDQ